MKMLLLLILVMLAAGVWVSGQMMLDPGYLLIAYRETTIEMSLWVGVIALLATVTLVYLSLWILRKLLGSGDSARRWRQNVRQKRSLAKSNAGVIEYLEGNWAAAQKKLDQAAAKSDMPLLGYIAAARAAAKNEDFDSTEQYLLKASMAEPGANLAIELAKVEVQMQRRQYEQALATLLKMRKEHPKHAYVCKRLQETYVALEDWESLSQLMPVLRKLKVAPAAELDEIAQKTALFQLEKVAREKSESGRAIAEVGRIMQVWSNISPKVRRNEAVTLAFTRHLQSLGKAEKAVQALEESINSQWSEPLVEQFGLIAGEDLHHQLLTAERWLKERNNSSVLMLALGRLSLRNKLWGKAREYFTSSIKVKNTVEACAELGRLLSFMGDDQGSSRYLQQSMELTQQGLPDLPMPTRQTSLESAS